MDGTARLAQLFQNIKVTRSISERPGLYAQIQEQFLNLPTQAAYETVHSLLNDENPKVRFYAVRLLGKNRVFLALKDLTHVLQSDEDDEVQAEAARALEELSDELSIEPLVTVLNDRKREMAVRYAAAQALGNFKTNEVIATLWDVFLDIGSYDLREIVVSALVQIGGDTVNDKFLAFLGDATILPDDKLEIIGGLGKLKNKTSVPALLNLLHHEYSELRAAAAEALGEIGDLSAIPALHLTLHDEKRYVRQCSEIALAKLEV